MSRHRSASSYGHHVKRLLGGEDYRISWTVDFYYEGSRLRFPRTFSRDTDKAGAERFCRRWKVTMPLPL